MLTDSLLLGRRVASDVAALRRGCCMLQLCRTASVLAAAPAQGRPCTPPFLSRSGSMTLRQIHFASVDLELHARFTPGKVRCCT